ncbi:heavy-metal-associated domain-containing protein [Xanthomonas sacchari]|nr:heavy-metal-associated domain-containing protein [Xanthomonas sacchari]
MHHLDLLVHGMSCGGCSARLQRVLDACPGVAASTVVLEGGRVGIDYDPARIDVATLEQAIADAGFSVVAG